MNTTSLASALDSLFGTISTCDSIFAKNGSTKGLISAANLASVLGGTVSPSSISDWDSAPNGFFATINNATNSPVSGYLTGLQIYNSKHAHYYQLAFKTSGNSIYFRQKATTTWTAWTELKGTAL